MNSDNHNMNTRTADDKNRTISSSSTLHGPQPLTSSESNVRQCGASNDNTGTNSSSSRTSHPADNGDTTVVEGNTTTHDDHDQLQPNSTTGTTPGSDDDTMTDTSDSETDDEDDDEEKQLNHKEAKPKKKKDEKQKQQEELERQKVPESMLQTDPQKGLSSNEVKARQKRFGPNALSAEKPNQFKKFLSYFIGPIELLIELAIILSAGLQRWVDFGVLAALLFLNATVGFLQEYHAGSVIDELKSTLSPSAHVIRDSQTFEVNAEDIVPGDTIELEEGDIIPADGKLLSTTDGKSLQVDQSTITGESMAVGKTNDDIIYSSSAVKRGEGRAIVTSIGENTFVGRAAKLASQTKDRGSFAAIMARIGNGLVALDLFCVFAIFIASYYRGISLPDILEYALITTAVSVPIALPTVITTTLAVGAQKMAAQRAVVSRLNSIEALASVDILCADKTGTLTQNKLSVHQPKVVNGHSTNEVMLAAYLASSSNRKKADPIDKAIIRAMKQYKGAKKEAQEYRVLEFTPFDPVTKRVTAIAQRASADTNERIYVTKGAPQVIRELVEKDAHPPKEIIDEYNHAVEDNAKRGFRSLGVAQKKEGGHWELLGVLPMFDPPRHDSEETIKKAQELGVKLKMLTGDQLIIAKETARQLKMGTNIFDSAKLGMGEAGGSELADYVEEADGFAQVFPEHKYQAVRLLQGRKHIVAMTGDGVNDAPALKAADVGIAVSGASDAARSASDLVFLDPGLSVIIDALKTSRQIFHRMNGYAQYRISLSIHLVIYVTLSIVIMNFFIDPSLIVFLAIFSDIAVLTIAFDNAPYSPTPVRWNLKRLVISALVLGGILAAGTFILHFAAGHLGIDTQSAVFLEIALSQSWLIFSCRQEPTDAWFSHRPGWSLLAAVFIVDIVASCFVLFGWLTPRVHIVQVVEIWLYSFFVTLVVGDFIRRILLMDFSKMWKGLRGGFNTDEDELLRRKEMRDVENRLYHLEQLSKQHEKYVPLNAYDPEDGGEGDGSRPGSPRSSWKRKQHSRRWSSTHRNQRKERDLEKGEGSGDSFKRTDTSRSGVESGPGVGSGVGVASEDVGKKGKGNEFQRSSTLEMTQILESPSSIRASPPPSKRSLQSPPSST